LISYKSVTQAIKGAAQYCAYNILFSLVTHGNKQERKELVSKLVSG